MLVMRGLESSACVALPLPCLPLLQLCLSLSLTAGVLCGVCFPLASGMFLHLCVLYGYQGADADAEQLDLTDHLFDAALGELHAVALGQPCLLVGDFNVEPTKIPCLAEGISAGLWVDFWGGLGSCCWFASCSYL